MSKAWEVRIELPPITMVCWAGSADAARKLAVEMVGWEGLRRGLDVTTTRELTVDEMLALARSDV